MAGGIVQWGGSFLCIRPTQIHSRTACAKPGVLISTYGCGPQTNNQIQQQTKISWMVQWLKKSQALGLEFDL